MQAQDYSSKSIIDVSQICDQNYGITFKTFSV